MIKPIGSDELKPLFVYDPDTHHQLMHEAEDLPSVVISSQAAGNAVMMGGGYFTPLTGFMNVADAMGTCESMRMTNGAFFPVPVMCLLENVDAIKDAKRIALRDPNTEGNPVLAVMDVEAIEEVSGEQMAFMTDKVYRTDDMEHPGVKAFNTVGNTLINNPYDSSQGASWNYYDDVNGAWRPGDVEGDAASLVTRTDNSKKSCNIALSRSATLPIQQLFMPLNRIQGIIRV